jgi:spectinomycin phosphotransferase
MMLEPPSIPPEKISACLQSEYGLQAESLTFLPLGADSDTAVYRLLSRANTPYFVRLRNGPFDEASVAIPKFLHDQGLSQVIPPVSTGRGRLWTDLPPFKISLFPYIDGHDGYEVDLSSHQWMELGRAFRRLHTLKLPESFSVQIRPESWSPVLRDSLRHVMEDIETNIYSDSLQSQCSAFLKEKQTLILDMLERAGCLAQTLAERSLEFCLCHGDLHAGNILLHAKGDLYIIDWDDLILAPKERDLMSIGASLFGNWRSPAEEEALFYQGYGQTQIDPVALAYYRYERILADLAVECRQIFEKGTGSLDRQQAFNWLRSNFLPGNAIELACQSDPGLKGESLC